MPALDEFLKSMNQKQVSIVAVNNYLRQSCEFEAPTRRSIWDTCERLDRIGLGRATNVTLNNGNGWNRDSHADGGSCNLNGNGPYYESHEISTSPFHSTHYREIKSEFERIMEIYLEASGGVAHNHSASTHTHTSIGYIGASNSAVINLPVMEMYRNVGAFMVRFLPVLKWLSMTNVNGARGAHNNNYDCLDGDALYNWIQSVQNTNEGGGGVDGHTSGSDQFLMGMARGSSLRIYNDRVFHFENRMMDCNFSATMMAAWFSLNRAIALFAYDMARNKFHYMPTREQVRASHQAAEHHRRGWLNVPKQFIIDEWLMMKSYLTKYFKLTNSMDALEVLDKLIDCPIPQYLAANGIGRNYDMTLLEKHFAVRIREKDVELRNKYLDAVKKFMIPNAPNLNDFHSNVAAFLGVQQKQAVSLYQMLKRENVDLEFMAGRLVYMGD